MYLWHVVDSMLTRISSIFAIFFMQLWGQFFRYWRRSRQWRPTLNGLKTALQAYRDDLLPHVAHGRQAFGILPRQRVHWSRTIRDVFIFRQLQTAPIRSTPVLCVYGKQDRLLQHIGFSDWAGYEVMIERICPGAQFRRIDSDHFFTGSAARRRLIEAVVQFFKSELDLELSRSL
jgi:hypothetical protein